MIIHTNSQAAGHGNLLNPTGGFLSKTASQSRAQADSTNKTHDAIVPERIGGVQSRVAEIADSKEAEETTMFARNYIRSNPLSSIGVQANTSSSAVLNLLSDLIYS